MKNCFGSAAIAALLSLPFSANAQTTFEGPCDRGPLPNVGIVNSPDTEFVLVLQEVFPGMLPETAELIGTQLCNDLDLVGDSAGLSQRLSELLRGQGY